MGNRWGNNKKVIDYWGGSGPKSLPVVTAAMELKDACSLKENL